jgi:hypothetical protein
MRIRDLLSGNEYEAELTTDHPASSNGQPVVVVDGEAIAPIDMEIIRATPDECRALPLWWRSARRWHHHGLPWRTEPCA